MNRLRSPNVKKTNFLKGNSPHHSPFKRAGTINYREDVELSRIMDDLDDNLDKHWTELRMAGKNPDRRGNHSTFFYNDCLYIYGGHDIREGSFSGLWRLNMKQIEDLDRAEEDQEQTCGWIRVETHGQQKPGPLAHHSSVVYADKMFLFGGNNDGKENTHLFMGHVPCSRDDHTAVVYKDAMYIFGGFIKGEKTNDIEKYNFIQNNWEKLNQDSSLIPPPRCSHSAAIINDKMIIFGGKDVEGEKLNDTWFFDLNSQKWEKQENIDPVPIKRSGHTASVYKNLMIVFGGIHEVTRELDDCWIYDPSRNEWIALFEETTNQQKERSAIKNSPFLRKQSLNKAQIKKLGNHLSKFNPESPNQSFSKLQVKETENSLDKTEIINNREKNNSSVMNPSKFIQSMIAKSKDPSRRAKNLSYTQKPSPQKNISIDGHKDTHRQSQLVTPTSISMMNSFIIQNADPSFEQYFKTMNKRKLENSALVDQKMTYGRIMNKRPQARDGHSAIIYEDEFYIFGGDRHHMPFNDIFCLEIKKEIDSKNYMF